MRAALPIALAAVVTGCGGDGDPVAAADAERCLKGEKLRVVAANREPGDTDAPDREVIVNGRDAFAFLAFYDDEERADRYAPEIREHTKEFKGALDRHGKLSIVWVKGRDSDEGERIRGCALD